MEPAIDVTAVPVVVLVTSLLSVLPVTGELVLGRRTEAGGHIVEIDDERVSRAHAAVRFDHGTWVITDRDSHNGTYVDGVRVVGEVRRRSDCVVRLGHAIFLLVRDGRGYDVLHDDGGEQIIGAELARLYDQVRRHAGDPTLLVCGESGSGKELIARLYHESGAHAGGPFVAVNCAAIHEGAAERLLFGSRDAVGYVQSADGGTLFLDDIADLDPSMQAKLLHAIETREITPVGANAAIQVDLGIVAASQRGLRTDLYDRLSNTTLRLPPLRERKLDLARLVLRELGGRAHARLLEACCSRPWPGNVRELLGALQRANAAALGEGRDLVRLEDLPANAGIARDDQNA